MNDENDSKNGPIYLVGMMGSGKSTIGPALAARLGRDFVDTDQWIEQKVGRSISAIFAEEGETHFRTLEREAVAAASQADAVIALGGGAFSQQGAAEEMLSRGIVVYLDAPTELILGRIGDAESRPLLAGLCEAERAAKLNALRKERSPDYAKATLRIEADGSTENLVDRIEEQISRSGKRASDKTSKRTQDG